MPRDHVAALELAASVVPQSNHPVGQDAAHRARPITTTGEMLTNMRSISICYRFRVRPSSTTIFAVVDSVGIAIKKWAMLQNTFGTVCLEHTPPLELRDAILPVVLQLVLIFRPCA